MKAKAVIMGKFAAEKQAALAIDRLLGACVHGDHVHTLFLDSAQREVSHADSTRKECSPTYRWAVKDASTAGAVHLQVEPDAVAGGVEVSAFAGPLAGVSGATGNEGRPPAQTPGIMVAVETSDDISQFLAVSVLDQCGARDIQRADNLGQVREWPGLDPVPLSDMIDVSRRDEKNHEAALLRPKMNSRHH